jgi:hypothetical protein
VLDRDIATILPKLRRYADPNEPFSLRGGKQLFLPLKGPRESGSPEDFIPRFRLC